METHKSDKYFHQYSLLNAGNIGAMLLLIKESVSEPVAFKSVKITTGEATGFLNWSKRCHFMMTCKIYKCSQCEILQLFSCKNQSQTSLCNIVTGIKMFNLWSSRSLTSADVR